MLVLGFALLWGGYDVMTWGYVLIRGWNIKFLTWSSPIHPYEWPKSGDPPKIPQGRLWPGGSGASTDSANQVLEQDVTGGTP